MIKDADSYLNMPGFRDNISRDGQKIFKLNPEWNFL